MLHVPCERLWCVLAILLLQLAGAVVSLSCSLARLTVRLSTDSTMGSAGPPGELVISDRNTAVKVMCGAILGLALVLARPYT